MAMVIYKNSKHFYLISVFKYSCQLTSSRNLYYTYRNTSQGRT